MKTNRMEPNIKKVGLHIFTEHGLQVKEDYEMSIRKDQDNTKYLHFKSNPLNFYLHS
jgi:hypothetical protein